MTNHATWYSRNEQRVAHDFGRFIADVEQLLNSAKQLTGDSADLARTKLEEKVAQAKVTLDAVRGRAAEQADLAAAATRGYVHERPLQALGIAVAVGAIVGLLLGRRL